MGTIETKSDVIVKKLKEEKNIQVFRQVEEVHALAIPIKKETDQNESLNNTSFFRTPVGYIVIVLMLVIFMIVLVSVYRYYAYMIEFSYQEKDDEELTSLRPTTKAYSKFLERKKIDNNIEQLADMFAKEQYSQKV